VNPPNVQDYTKIYQQQQQLNSSQGKNSVTPGIASTGMGKINLINMGFKTPDVENLAFLPVR
jgi:hypothetical protein